MTAPSVELPGSRAALEDLFRVVSAPLQTISADDLGLFGPGSVAWRIHRDPSYGIGGIASLFHQALHPVRDHSGVAEVNTTVPNGLPISGATAARFRPEGPRRPVRPRTP